MKLKLRPRDIALTLAPGVGWWLAFRTRPFVIRPRCTESPGSCAPESVFFLDRVAIREYWPRADRWSFIGQDFSAYYSLTVPLLYTLTLVILLKRWKPLEGTRNLLTGWVLLIQCTLWNGLFLELTRLVVQRPRPFVYLHHPGFGSEPANYTSFYSGHTSFAATAATGLFIVLTAMGASRKLTIPVAIGSIALVILTGTCRVLAGRHFPTDVLAAAVAGCVLALAVGKLHRT